MMHFEQLEICMRFNAPFTPPEADAKLGVSRNVQSAITPINGLRHRATAGTSGWYVWRGEDLPDDANFFEPLHVSHIAEWLPEVEKFLALPAGWRFLKAGEHEDVWFDETLLRA